MDKVRNITVLTDMEKDKKSYELLREEICNIWKTLWWEWGITGSDLQLDEFIAVKRSVVRKKDIHYWNISKIDVAAPMTNF